MLVDGSRALVLLDLMRGFEIFLLLLQLGQSEAGARVGSGQATCGCGYLTQCD